MKRTLTATAIFATIATTVKATSSGTGSDSETPYLESAWVNRAAM